MVGWQFLDFIKLFLKSYILRHVWKHSNFKAKIVGIFLWWIIGSLWLKIPYQKNWVICWPSSLLKELEIWQWLTIISILYQRFLCSKFFFFYTESHGEKDISVSWNVIIIHVIGFLKIRSIMYKQQTKDFCTRDFPFYWKIHRNQENRTFWSDIVLICTQKQKASVTFFKFVSFYIHPI